MHDNDRLNLSQWKEKHNKWAEFESKDVFYNNDLKNKSNMSICFKITKLPLYR